MGVGTSIVLIAVGAILRFAVSVTTTGFNIHSIGIILMVVVPSAAAVDRVLELVGRRVCRRKRLPPAAPRSSDGAGGYVEEDRSTAL